MSNFGKNLVIWAAIAIAAVALYQAFGGSSSRGQGAPLAFSEFLSSVDTNKVSEVTITGNVVSGRMTDGRTFRTYLPPGSGVVPKLIEKNVRVSAQPVEEPIHPLGSMLLSWAPFLVLIGVWI